MSPKNALFVAFLAFLIKILQKYTKNKEKSTCIWIAQHPNAGQNIQQMRKSFSLKYKAFTKYSLHHIRVDLETQSVIGKKEWKNRPPCLIPNSYYYPNLSFLLHLCQAEFSCCSYLQFSKSSDVKFSNQGSHGGHIVVSCLQIAA